MIAIVTDSSVGYSTAEIASRGIVSVVPLNYQLGKNLYEEYASDRNGNFMPLLASESPCKTAQPALSNFIRTFSTLVERGCDVICIVLSSALSGTYSSACFAADQVGGNIRVVDSETIGAGMHLLVDEAVNMVKCGLSFEEIVRHLDGIKKRIGIAFTVESLDRLIAGGRLNNPKAKTTLNLRPVFVLRGKIVFKGNARGSRRAHGRAPRPRSPQMRAASSSAAAGRGQMSPRSPACCTINIRPSISISGSWGRF